MFNEAEVKELIEGYAHPLRARITELEYRIMALEKGTVSHGTQVEARQRGQKASGAKVEAKLPPVPDADGTGEGDTDDGSPTRRGT